MFNINYGTGAGNESAETLWEAKALADEGAAYTQADIVITDEDGDEVARRTWCGVAYDADECGEENPINFGDYGYYTDWVDM